MDPTKFSFLHCADLHLDSPFVGIDAIEPQLAKILRESTFSSFDNIVDLAIEHAVDFVLIGGDVYDSAEHSLRAQIRFRDSIQRLCSSGIPCYMIHGNHDPLNSWDAKLDLPENAFRFGGDRVERKTVTKSGQPIAHVHGISFLTREVDDNLAVGFKKKEDECFSIGLLHCNVGGQQNHDNYAPCSLEDLRNSGMDYWALGHVHTRQVVSEASPTVVYPGNIQGRSIRETGARGCYHVTIESGTKPELKFFPTEVIRWFNEDDATIDAQNLETLDELLESLHELKETLRENSENRPSIGRIKIEGRSQIHPFLSSANEDNDLLSTLRSGEPERSDCVWIESITIATRRIVDIERRRTVDDFVGDFLNASQQLRGDEIASKIRQVLLSQPEANKIAKEINNFSDHDLETLLDSAEQLGLDDLLTDEN